MGGGEEMGFWTPFGMLTPPTVPSLVGKPPGEAASQQGLTPLCQPPRQGDAGPPARLPSLLVTPGPPLFHASDGVLVLTPQACCIRIEPGSGPLPCPVHAVPAERERFWTFCPVFPPFPEYCCMIDVRPPAERDNFDNLFPIGPDSMLVDMQPPSLQKVQLIAR